MKLVYGDVAIPLIDDTHFNVIVAEQREMYCAMHNELANYSMVSEPRFVLSQDGCEIDIEANSNYIGNPFEIACSDRSWQTRLQKSLVNQYCETEEAGELIRKFEQLRLDLEDLVATERWIAVAEKQIHFEDILKIFSIGFELFESDDTVLRLEDYLLIQRDYVNINTFFVRDLMTCLDVETVKELSDFALREEMTICSIERYLPEEFITAIAGRVLVIDNDQCEILFSAS